jgi:glycogen synthase
VHILLIPNSYPPILGGLQTVTHTLAQHLVRRGHEVQVVTNRYPRSLPAREVLDGVPVQRWMLLNPAFASLRRKRPDLFLASLYFGPTARLRLLRLIRTFRPEVINVHFPDAQIPAVLWLRRRCRFRLVVSLHGDEIERWFSRYLLPCPDPLRSPSGRPHARHGTADRRTLPVRLQTILREADAVTACSQYLLERAIRLEPTVAAKGRAILNGIDPTRFRSKTRYPHPRSYIFSYGRLTYKKGFDLLLQAFARITAHHPDLDLIIAGEGEEQSHLELLSEQLGLCGRAIFYGRATPQEVVALLNGCELAAIPSRQEPFGIVALEALAAGKQLIATRVGGLAELLTEIRDAPAPPPSSLCGDDTGPAASPHRPLTVGPTAMLVEPTVEGLADGLRRSLDAATSGARRARVLDERALDRYSWDQVARRYETVLTEHAG